MNWALFITEHFTASVIFVAIFGAMIGSFLNVIIYRYPIMLMREWDNTCRGQLNEPTLKKQEPFNLCLPRSHCTTCKKIIPFWFNIPIISFLFLRGKCAYCRAPISLQYWLVEFISAIATVIVFLHFSISLLTFEVLIFTYGLVILGFIDFNYQFLPDLITYILLWLGLAVSTQRFFTYPFQAIYGAMIGYLFLWLIAKGYLLLRKKEGMGLGDCKLLAMIGAWVGATSLLDVLLFSTALALIISTVLLLFKKIEHHKPIPFGPYIAIAGWYTVVYGPQFSQWIARWTV